MNFDRKILTTFLIMNERITSKKKPQKLHKFQHFFGFQLAGAAPVLLLRATGVSSTSHYSPSRKISALRVTSTLRVITLRAFAWR